MDFVRGIERATEKCGKDRDQRTGDWEENDRVCCVTVSMSVSIVEVVEFDDGGKESKCFKVVWRFKGSMPLQPTQKPCRPLGIACRNPQLAALAFEPQANPS